MAKKNFKEIIKEFKLSSLAVDNRISVLMIMSMIILFGLSAYRSMPKENFPEINLPQILVQTRYPGNSPLDIENLITRPIEKEINSINGITKLSSESIQDFSFISVEFGFDVDISEALLDVKDAVDKADLPNDLDNDPGVTEIDFSEIPIININISGDNYSHDELKFYAEFLEDEIENLPEISEVDLKGALEKEVKINVDRHKMESLEISFRDVENAVDGENQTISGGDILTDNFRRSIRIDGEFDDYKQIGDIIVKDQNQKIVYLKDIAEIRFDFKETDSYSRIYKSPVITLDVKKKSGENLLNAADKIKEIIATAEKERLPDDVQIQISNDTSRMTRYNVENLENSIISGVILVVLVLLFFLGLRNSLFVGVAIPLSMLLSFIILSTAGVTLNLMVLFSLVLALGMMVDNGIVVVENIYRLMQEGYTPIRAAKEGVGEVAWPIISSTATTLAAFVPLLFWDDIMGEFMKYLPMTLIIVLSSSLFVALVINPVLTSMFMKVQEGQVKVNMKRLGIMLGIMVVISLIAYVAKSFFIANALMLTVLIILLNVYVLSPLSTRFQEVFLPRLEGWYNNLISYALYGKRPVVFFFGMFGLLFASIVFFIARQPDVVLFPETESNYLNVFIEMPTGTDIEKANELTRKIEDDVINLIQQYEILETNNIESVLANVGKGTSDPNQGLSVSSSASPNKAKINVSFVEYQNRSLPGDKTTNTIIEEIRALVKKYPGADITVAGEPAGPPVGPPISIEISGEDFKTLIKIAERAKKHINNSNIAGIENLKTDLDIGKPELLIDINRDASRRFGVSTQQIAGGIRTALFGKEVSKYKDGEDEYPIMLRLKDEYRYDLESLLNQKITFRDQSKGEIVQVPISAVADVRYSTTYGSVKRKELDRVITLYSNVLDGYNPANIISQLGEIFEDFPIPEGYQIKYTGEVEEQEKSMAFLGTAFTIAVFLIFLIIISQFNSLSSPIIIMLSVLFSTIGVLIGLAAFNMEFVVIMTGIGLISLAGVVVNNAIVLIDYTNLVRDRRKMDLGLESTDRLPKKDLIEVIKQGGMTRLRPVLLTAITTVLGLLPLAVGFNINFGTMLSDFDPNIYFGGDNVAFWGPMSWTIIFGLTFATFLTLVIVPVMYLLFDRLTNRVEKLFG